MHPSPASLGMRKVPVPHTVELAAAIRAQSARHHRLHRRRRKL